MADGANPEADVERIRLWDPGVRAFHWALAALVTASWLLGEFGPAIMTMHFWSGYAICALLAFRLVWGVVGPRPARFAAFLAGPKTVLNYARTLPERAPSRWRGHNPLGGWAVAALLALLAAQVATGLVADPEDYINVGPLADMVSADMRRTATAWHHRIGSALLALVALHVAAVVFYKLWKREDLIRPMIDGWKTVRRE
ncbi:MAG: cytochrome b/b6 domain-containing protein [Rubrimonas sp.]|uniref:cytochrome b/b6 domain-containing protein n=1 Tax=Rubrimonas sp. TaxID=2036015 RepID=UPI002FDD2CD8